MNIADILLCLCLKTLSNYEYSWHTAHFTFKLTPGINIADILLTSRLSFTPGINIADILLTWRLKTLSSHGYVADISITWRWRVVKS